MKRLPPRLARLGLAAALAIGASAAYPAPAHADDGVDVEIAFERYTLDNGLEVILHQDNSAPLVAVDVWYHVGSGDETPGKSGFAHLFEHMMFQGAKHIGEDVHFETLKKIGASGVNGTTNTDRTNYFEVVPSNHLETALWLESDRMGYMLDLLNEESLENQRDVVRNERRQNYDTRAYARERFAIAAALYPEGHPYRYLTIGRHEDVEGGSLDDVQGFFNEWYVPSNATLTIAGDFQTEDAKKAVAKWFGSFPKLDKPTHREVSTPVLDSTVREIVDDPYARRTRVHYAWHSVAALDEGEPELEMLARVMGASGWGRLYKRLVLDEDVAESVWVYQDGRNRSGEFHVVVTLKKDAELKRVEKLLGDELSAIISEPISKKELARVVNVTVSGFVWGLEQLMGRAERLQYWNHYAGDPGYTDEYLARVRKVDPAGVQRMARKILSQPRAEIITMPAPKKDADEGGAK